MSDVVTVVAGTTNHEGSLVRKNIFNDEDDDDDDVAILLSSVRNAVRARRYRDAVKDYDKTLARTSRSVDANGRLAVDVLNDSACALAKLGRDAEARERLVECLRLRNALLKTKRPYVEGENDLATVLAVARTLHNLGRCSSSTEEALKAFAEATRLRSNCLGRHHPAVTSSASGSARAKFLSGDHDGALDEYHRALLTSEKLHRTLDAAATRYNMAQIHLRRKDYAAALKVLEGTSLILLSEKHPLVSLTWHALGVARRGTGNLDDSLKSFRRALELRKSKFGDSNHLAVVSTTLQLAILRRYRKEEGECLTTFQGVIRTLVSRLGRDHTMTSEAMKEYGDALVDFGRYAKAIAIFRTLVTSLRRSSDRETSLADALHSLGRSYSYVRNRSAALTVWAESYLLRKKSSSRKPDRSAALSSTLRAMADCRRSGSVEYDETATDDDDPDAADLYHALGDEHRVAGNHVPAVEAYGRALRIRRKRFGIEHPSSTAAEFRLGRALFKVGRTDEALETLRSCLESRRRRAKDAGDDGPETREAIAMTVRNVAEVLGYVQRTARTKNSFNEADGGYSV